ncbi:hypothetical protein psyc5s11_41820 [Clostridium gelidum]|uniref:Lipoprotein n=1 Tax=Clostridium gelidum TaxID=704125 RepID=A0ABM7TAI2_9CLOT|nr:hypothetical protein [Clostridium gelidum]BCZ48115.1 hypothetical protein psyc5s11_41820 [Clostridium gelidum]
MFLLLFSFVSCSAPKNISKPKPLSVSIVNDVDTYGLYMSSVKGITLLPKLEETTDKDIQYHWSINSDTKKFKGKTLDTEMFDTPNGPVKEIINSGESVLFIVVAEISYAKPDTLSREINVTLTVEEKDSNNVLAKSELIIEDYSGTYKVKKVFDELKIRSSSDIEIYCALSFQASKYRYDNYKKWYKYKIMSSSDRCILRNFQNYLNSQ